MTTFPDYSASPDLRLVTNALPLEAPVLSGTEAAPGLLIIATGALGMALRVNFGQYDRDALLWLTISIVAAGLGVFRSQSRTIEQLNRHLLPLFPALAMAVAVVLMCDAPLSRTRPLAPFQAFTALGAAGMLIASIGRKHLARWGIALMVLAQIGACLWTIRVASQPPVDVCMFQRESADALLHGSNPYALTFEDPYGSKSSFYGDGIVKDGRLQFGYPYPPLPLFMVLPGHLLGDFRISMLVAIVLAGALIATMRPGRIAPLAAGLLLFTSRGLFVLEAGWIEPLVVVLLAAVVFTACRFRGSEGGAILLGILTGLLFASKQYLIVAAPLLWLLPVVRDRATRWRFLIAMIAAGLVVTLPLALWDPKAFLWSTAILQFHQPFRPDALSFLVPLQAHYERTPPAWIALLLAPIVAIACARRLRPTPSNFAAAMAMTLLVLFAVNKQAFCNYYHLVIGALASAIAAFELKKKDLNQEATKSTKHDPAFFVVLPDPLKIHS